MCVHTFLSSSARELTTSLLCVVDINKQGRIRKFLLKMMMNCMKLFRTGKRFFSCYSKNYKSELCFYIDTEWGNAGGVRTLCNRLSCKGS